MDSESGVAGMQERIYEYTLLEMKHNGFTHHGSARGNCRLDYSSAGGSEGIWWEILRIRGNSVEN